MGHHNSIYDDSLSTSFTPKNVIEKIRCMAWSTTHPFFIETCRKKMTLHFYFIVLFLNSPSIIPYSNQHVYICFNTFSSIKYTYNRKYQPTGTGTYNLMFLIITQLCIRLEVNLLVQLKKNSWIIPKYYVKIHCYFYRIFFYNNMIFSQYELKYSSD